MHTYYFSGSRLCSKHFLIEKNSDPDSPDFIPSIFPTGHIIHPATPRANDRLRRRRLRERSKDDAQAASSLAAAPGGDEEEEDTDTESIGDVVLYEMSDTLSDLDTDTDTASEGVNDPILLDYWTQTVKGEEDWNDLSFECVSISGTVKQCQAIIPLDKKTDTRETQVWMNMTNSATSTEQEKEESAALPFLSFKDKQFYAFTGLSKTQFQFFIYRIGGNISDSAQLSGELKVVLLFVKLKSNMNFVNLACMFDVSEYRVKGLFLEALEAVYEAVKRFIVWFNRQTIQARMPASFKGLFPKTRSIIDASEVECSRPPCPVKRVKMFSHYKGRFTIKYLVSCAPSGEITFVSKGFGGRTTDTEITVKSGFINLIEPGDTVMADKGFPSIEAKLAEAGGLLVMPPFRRGQKHFQFSASQNSDGYKIASVRVHVERAIERMKRFMILDYVRMEMRDHFDKILVIISAVCNVSNDLIRQ